MKKMKKFYLYRKIILSFLILNFVSITIISGVLSIIFTTTARKELYNSCMNSLSRMELSVSKIYESLSPAINFILTDGDTASFMEQTEIDRVGELKILEDLKGLGTANTQFKYVGVANLYTDRYLGTRGVYTGLDESLKDERMQNPGLYCIPRAVHHNENMENSPLHDVLTFVYVPMGRHAKGRVIIDIDVKEFRELLTGAETFESVYVFDKKGNLLISPENTQAGSDLYEDFLPEILDKKQNYYEEKINGTAYAVASLQSESTGWYFVSLRLKNNMLPAMKNLIYTIVIAEAVLIVASLIFTFVLASRVYRPLGTLYKRLNKMKDQDNGTINEIEAFDTVLASYEKKNTDFKRYKDKTDSLLSEYWLKGVARGEISCSDDGVPENCIYAFSGGNYRVLLLSFCDYAAFERQYSERDREIIEFALGNILEELLEGFCITHLIMAERNCRMIILKTPSKDMSDEIVLAIGEAQKHFMHYMHVLTSACYSKAIMHWRELPEAYHQARESRRKQLFLGEGCIIDGAYDYGRKEQSVYPYRVVKTVGEAIVQKNESEAEKGIENLIGRFKQMGVDDILNFSSQACFELSQKYSSGKSSTRDYTFQEIYNAVLKMETMDEIKALFLRLCSQLISEHAEKDSFEPKDAVSIARKYIEDHYQDAGLSVEMLAEVAGLSPAYFGKIFTAGMNQSCSDYIAEVRMANAMRLLAETDRTINDISIAVGLSNTNYFYSLFKKRYGMTPAQYRRKMKEENRNE